MNYSRRKFLENSVTSTATLSTLALLGASCVCNQRKNSSAPHSTCCFTPDIEPDSLSTGEKSLIIDLTKAPSLSAAGTAAFIVNQEKQLQIIVVRSGEKEYSATSRLCTHGNQVLSYNEQRGVLQCNGFNHSIFALDGQVIKGPAPTALKSYKVTLADEKLEIAL